MMTVAAGLLLVCAVACAVSAVVCALLVRAGHRLNAMDGAGAAGHAKSAIRRVPNVGGIGIVLGIVCSVGGAAAALALGWTGDGLPWDAAAGVRDVWPMALALLGVVLVLHVMGLVDDRRPLPAGPKLIVMLACAAVFPVFFETRLFEFFDPLAGGSWLSVVLTVLWIAAVTNALNFMDNADGLAAGTTLVAAAIFAVAAVASGQWFVAGMLASIVGSCAGFLVWNAPKARLFMGDGGSLVLGFLFGFLTVRTTYFDADDASAGVTWFAVLMPACVLAVPLYDLVSVSAVRLSQGRSPFVGDEQHLSHRLIRRGLTHWQMLAVVWGATAATGLAGLMLSRLEGVWGIAAGVQVLIVLCVLAVAEWGSRGRSA